MREADLAIIGAGVAGLTAAAAAARQGLRVLVIERMGAGGQVINVEQIDNMPGFAKGISGFELGPELQEQAETAGAEFMLDTVLGLAAGQDGRHVLRCEGEDVTARAVLVASGSARKKLGVPGEDLLEGRGVSHCASCDGPLFRKQAVCVAGGGDSAFGEAAVLAGHASHVTIVFPEDEPRAQPYLLDAVHGLPNVAWVAKSRVAEIIGDSTGVTAVRVEASDGSARELPVQGVFVYAGLQPDTGFLGGAVQLDTSGRIETDEALRTSVPGIFAAGDIRGGASYLLVTAASDGEAAALSACRYLNEQPA
ncbi:MAG: FAD-binding protein [Ramlibacter sp.]|nr:FAD-binding protein [Ramlibacter sp.]